MSEFNTYKYKGFEIRQSGNDFDVRRDYPASVHKGYPAPFIPAVRNAVSVEQAKIQLEAFIASRP